MSHCGQKKIGRSAARCNSVSCGSCTKRVNFGMQRQRPNTECLKLDEIYDTDVKDAKNGQYLCYTGGHWIPGNVSQVGGAPIVPTSSLQSGQFLSYNADEEEWNNTDICELLSVATLDAPMLNMGQSKVPIITSNVQPELVATNDSLTNYDNGNPTPYDALFIQHVKPTEPATHLRRISYLTFDFNTPLVTDGSGVLAIYSDNSGVGDINTISNGQPLFQTPIIMSASSSSTTIVEVDIEIPSSGSLFVVLYYNGPSDSDALCYLGSPNSGINDYYRSSTLPLGSVDLNNINSSIPLLTSPSPLSINLIAEFYIDGCAKTTLPDMLHSIPVGFCDDYDVGESSLDIIALSSRPDVVASGYNITETSAAYSTIIGSGGEQIFVSSDSPGSFIDALDPNAFPGPGNFTFPFFGETFDTAALSFSPNGLLGMPGYPLPGNTYTPNVSPMYIGLMWTDYEPNGSTNGGAAGDIYYKYETSPNRLIIEYDTVGFYDGGSDRASFQFVLYDDGRWSVTVSYTDRTSPVIACWDQIGTVYQTSLPITVGVEYLFTPMNVTIVYEDCTQKVPLIDAINNVISIDSNVFTPTLDFSDFSGFSALKDPSDFGENFYHRIGSVVQVTGGINALTRYDGPTGGSYYFEFKVGVPPGIPVNGAVHGTVVGFFQDDNPNNLGYGTTPPITSRPVTGVVEGFNNDFNIIRGTMSIRQTVDDSFEADTPLIIKYNYAYQT